MKKIFLVALCIAMMMQATMAQVWFFGQNAGLQFNGANPPTPILTGGPISTGEGCAVANDNTGTPILVTNGVAVLGRNGAGNFVGIPMTPTLSGGPSATQSAIIVPAPGGNCQKYFIFSVAQAEAALAGGLTYAVVERDAGGNWSVPRQPTRLGNNILFTEKLSAVARPDGSFWVVAHNFADETATDNDNGRSFYSILVDATATATNTIDTGIITASLIGGKHQRAINTTNYQPAQGQMKFSPDHTRIALATTYTGGPTANVSGFVEAFNFDETTGMISGPVQRISFAQGNIPYGVEFSANSSFLYVSTIYNTPEAGTLRHSRLYQFDLTDPNFSNAATLVSPTNVPAYARLLGGDDTLDFGALQLAPNGAIYLAVNGIGLGSITNINAFPATFTHNAIPLAATRRGLPTVIQNNFVCGESPSICCADLANLVLNGDFEQGNAFITSQYAYSTAGLAPGQYTVTNQEQTLCANWNFCNNTNFLAVNGRTQQVGNPRNIWGQNIAVTEGDTYKICFNARAFPSCCFDIAPSLSLFANNTVVATFNIVNQQQLGGGCNMYEATFTANSNNIALSLRLNETGNGDGNDFGIDNISLVRLPTSSVPFTSSIGPGCNITASINTLSPNDDALPNGCSHNWVLLDMASEEPAVVSAIYGNLAWGSTTSFPYSAAPPGNFTCIPGHTYWVLSHTYDCDCLADSWDIKKVGVVTPLTQAQKDAVIKYVKAQGNLQGVNNRTNDSSVQQNLMGNTAIGNDSDVQQNLMGNTTISSEKQTVVKDLGLAAIPVPTTGKMDWKVSLPEAGDETSVLNIYNMSGQIIHSISLSGYPQGEHYVPFNPADFNLSGGVYLGELKSNNTRKIAKMVYTK